MESLRSFLGLEVQFVLTTKLNAEGEQCYEARDSVTAEIKNHQGQDCTTKAQIQDNKDGSYKVSYFAKETGICDVSVKVNEQHVHGSPFAIQVKARTFRPDEFCEFYYSLFFVFVLNARSHAYSYNGKAGKDSR